MSDNNENKVHGIVAEFDSVDTLLAACRRVRDAGYEKTDAFTPFPVHGIDNALGIKPTKLPWIVLVCGLAGTCTALAMQVWMNGIDYPYIISGKPYISLPAFMPVAFELTILFASFGAFFGMWALNGLPRFSNPIFTNPRFDRATDDTFFLYIDSKDERFDTAGVEQLLGETGGEHITSVVSDDSSAAVPRWFFTIWGLVAALSIIPLLIVLKMRVTNSTSPRFHIFYDMDFSPAKDAQQGSSLFADGRAMRADVPGTVARGETGGDMDFLTGINMEELAQVDGPRADRLVAAVMNPQEQKDDEQAPKAAAPAPSVMDTTPWLKENPLEVNLELVERGEKYFGIYCSVCHGMNGGGNGLVNRRAQKILAATWIPPSSLHSDTLTADKYPDGKLFSTISNGIRKMPGYAGQIKTRDRWAIVAYVRALQKSQNASLDLVPADKRDELKKRQAEVEKQLAEQAEAERKAEEERAKQAAS
ncbi:MAG: quinol:electron acceptor oxidoreductase subunit ActD [Rubripirellula sp.]